MSEEPIKPGIVRRYRARYYCDDSGPKCERTYEDGAVEIIDVPLYESAGMPSLTVVDEVGYLGPSALLEKSPEGDSK